jgi:hypothetical protein
MLNKRSHMTSDVDSHLSHSCSFAEAWDFWCSMPGAAVCSGVHQTQAVRCIGMLGHSLLACRTHHFIPSSQPPFTDGGERLREVNGLTQSRVAVSRGAWSVGATCDCLCLSSPGHPCVCVLPAGSALTPGTVRELGGGTWALWGVQVEDGMSEMGRP